MSAHHCPFQVSIKNMLYGTSDSEPQTDIVVSQLAQELYNSNLLLLLIQNLNRIDFEGKKDVAQVFNNVLRRQIGTRSPTVEYICTKPEILFTLIAGYEHQEIALNCGTMLRECARYEALAKIMLHSEEFFNFFQYVEVSTFDIASDAFSTFKVSSLWSFLSKEKLLPFPTRRSFSPATKFFAPSFWKPTTTESSRTINDYWTLRTMSRVVKVWSFWASCFWIVTTSR